MKRRGFIFLDILVGLFIIGLIVVVSFPILDLTQKSFKKSEELMEMIYVSETTVESLKCKDQMAVDFLSDLNKAGELEYPCLENPKYTSRVKLLDKHGELWFLNIKVNKKNDEGGKEYVELKATIPK